MADLSRALSQAELGYLRNVHEASLRGSGAVLVIVAFMLAAIAFRFGYLIFNGGSTIWGGIILFVGVALLFAGIRTLIGKTNSTTLEFRPEILQGHLNWRVVGAGKAKQRQYFIGDNPVSLPGYWLKTLKQLSQPMLKVRAALPTFATTANHYLPYTLLEVDGGPSIEFEAINTTAKRPANNVWFWIVFGAVSLLCIVTFVLFFLSVTDRNSDIVNDTRAAVSNLFFPTTYANIEEFYSGTPKVGNAVKIKSAWCVPTGWMKDVPSDVRTVLVSQDTRDRIIKERENFAIEYARAAQSSSRPKELSVLLQPNDKVIYLSHEPADQVLSYKKDPVTESLEKAIEVTATLGSNQKPHLLLNGREEEMILERGYFVIAGTIGLVIFVLFVTVGIRDVTRRKKFTNDIRKAYSEQLGFCLL